MAVMTVHTRLPLTLTTTSTLSLSSSQFVFGLWEETGASGENTESQSHKLPTALCLPSLWVSCVISVNIPVT